MSIKKKGEIWDVDFTFFEKKGRKEFGEKLKKNKENH